MVIVSHQSQNIVLETDKVLFVLRNLNVPKYVGSDKFVKEHLSIEFLTYLKEQIC